LTTAIPPESAAIRCPPPTNFNCCPFFPCKFGSWEGCYSLLLGYCYSVTPILYETILYGRAAKTAEAKRNLQIIFETRSYDPGQYWDDPSGLQDQLLRLCNKGTSDIQSLITSYISQTYEEIEKVNEFVDKKADE
jgi:hypothetical protein